jgi:hypothetical protein
MEMHILPNSVSSLPYGPGIEPIADNFTNANQFGGRLLTDNEAARELGVSAATLRSWRCRGIGPSFIKMGRGAKAPVRYSASDIVQFIAECRQVPPVRAAQEN